MVGPNGAGKTTLLNMLIGKLEPDEGAVRLGANLEIASLEQSRDSLKPDWTVADALTAGSGDTCRHQRRGKARRGLYAGFPVSARADADAA